MSEEGKVMKMMEAVKDPVRLRILFLLIKKGRTNVGDIAKEFEITRPAISHHLKVLKEAGVVSSVKKGQEVYYWPNAQAVAEALRDLADRIERNWAPRRRGSAA